MRENKKFAIYFLVLSFLSFLFLEIYVRNQRFHSHIDLMALTGVKIGLSPMAEWALGDAYCAFIPAPRRYGNNEKKSVNRYSFISTPDMDFEKPENTVRIVFFGGSSTAGTGYILSDSMSWPSKAIKMVQDSFPSQRFDFMNAASSGYSTFESYGRFWSRIRFFKPDIIIVNHGWNEMYYFSKADSIIGWKTDEEGEWSLHKKRRYGKQYEPRFYDGLISWSQLFCRIRIKFSKPIAGEIGNGKLVVLDGNFNQKGIDVFRTNIGLFKSTSELLGIEMMVCKQPTLIVEGLEEEQRKRCQYQFHGFDHNAHVQAYNAIYAVIDSLIPEGDIIDLRSVSGNATYFYDHVHPTDEGTSAYAKLVSKALIEKIQAQQIPESPDM